MKSNHNFFYRNGLTLVLILLFLGSIIGQILAGVKEYNNEREENHKPPVTLAEYFSSGHFYQATFENWESEFLQMGMYVLLTVWLRQVGSSESKSLDDDEEVDREPDPNKPDVPWPVRKGGFILKIYQNSLSIAFAILFLTSFSLHAAGSFKSFNEEQRFKDKQEIPFREFIGQSRFWFESFQNWQSEFVAVISIVVLSIFLRQKGSPESKPVDASNDETGS